MENSTCTPACPGSYPRYRDNVHAFLSQVCIEPVLVLSVPRSQFLSRWLVNQGRNDEALIVLSNARGLSPDADLVQIEFLYVFFHQPVITVINSLHREIKAQYLFEKETSEIKFPQYQDGTFSSNFKLGFYDYLSLLKERSSHRTILLHGYN